MIPVFGPGWGNYALRDIMEAALPEPVTLYPQTPGWWLLLAALVFAGGRYAWQRRQHWLRNRYRRQALEELGDIRRRLAESDHSAVRDLAPLLRATALAAGDRRELASLSGNAWAAAINDLAPELTPLPVHTLEELAYAPLDSESAETGAGLIESLATWIECHGGAHA